MEILVEKITELVVLLLHTNLTADLSSPFMESSIAPPAGFQERMAEENEESFPIKTRVEN